MIATKWTTTSRWVVGVFLIVLFSGANAFMTYDGHEEVSAAGVFILYALAMFGIAFGTVHLFKTSNQRVRLVMAGALVAFAGFAIWSAVRATDGAPVAFIAQMFIAALFVNAGVLAFRYLRR